MKKIKLTMVLLFLSTGTVMAQQAKVTSLMSKDLTEIPGRGVARPGERSAQTYRVIVDGDIGRVEADAAAVAKTISQVA